IGAEGAQPAAMTEEPRQLGERGEPTDEERQQLALRPAPQRLGREHRKMLRQRPRQRPGREVAPEDALLVSGHLRQQTPPRPVRRPGPVPDARPRLVYDPPPGPLQAE